MDRNLIYIGDPMCSWCWGFAPVIRDIVARVDDRATFSIVMGGLRSETGPVPQQRRDMYRQLWPRIASQTGQPFACQLVFNDDFSYDTEPPCRAVVVTRAMAGDLCALDMFERLQHAFYAENHDITQSDCCVQIATQLGLDETDFAEQFHSHHQKEVTQDDFRRTRNMGVTGFPTVVVAAGEGKAVLTHGYQPLVALGSRLEQLLGQNEQERRP